MASLRLIEAINQPSKVASEDLFDYRAQAAWIFDGASGIGPSTIAGAPSDPHWLVHELNARTKDAWRDDLDTRDILRAAAEAAIAAYARTVGEPIPPMIDRPTACLLLARLWRGKLEVSAVGDCWLVHGGAGGIADFGCKISDDVAAPVRDALKRLQGRGLTPSALFDQLLPFEREVRAKANADGGYAIVDLTTRWVERLTQARFDVAPGDRLLLMTDGLYRLIDTFGAYTAATLFEAVTERGLTSLHEELRALEAADESCEAFPRAKVRDDVAAALLVVDA